LFHYSLRDHSRTGDHHSSRDRSRSCGALARKDEEKKEVEHPDCSSIRTTYRMSPTALKADPTHHAVSGVTADSVDWYGIC